MYEHDRVAGSVIPLKSHVAITLYPVVTSTNEVAIPFASVSPDARFTIHESVDPTGADVMPLVTPSDRTPLLG